MFIIKKKTLKFAGAIFCAVICILIIIFNVANSVKETGAKQLKINQIILDESAKMCDLLNKFGYETEPEPYMVEQITIPNEFNDVYNKYNDMQKKQELNLTPFKGKNIKKWSFKITNYPEQDGKVIIANLLIYKNKLIALDITSPEIKGFMHGLDRTNILDEIAVTKEEK